MWFVKVKCAAACICKNTEERTRFVINWWKDRKEIEIEDDLRRGTEFMFMQWKCIFIIVEGQMQSIQARLFFCI